MTCFNLAYEYIHICKYIYIYIYTHVHSITYMTCNIYIYIYIYIYIIICTGEQFLQMVQNDNTNVWHDVVATRRTITVIVQGAFDKEASGQYDYTTHCVYWEYY